MIDECHVCGYLNLTIWKCWCSYCYFNWVDIFI